MQNQRWSRSVYVALIFTFFFIPCSTEGVEASPRRDQEPQELKRNPLFYSVGMNGRLAYAPVILYSFIRLDANNPC